MAKTIGLAAIQPKLALHHYKDKTAFFQWIDKLASQAMEKIAHADYQLLCFPEAIGLPFLVHPITEKKQNAATITQAFLQTMISEWKLILPYLPQSHFSLLRALYLAKAKTAYAITRESFAQLAQKHQAYISAGSLYLPQIENDPLKGFVIQAAAVKNRSFFFNPEGKCLGEVTKVHLVPGDETKAKFTPGKREHLLPFHLPFGKVGVLICYDAFHETLVERYDALGVQFLIQPSFNTDSWEKPWKFDPSVSQAEAWVRDGIRKMVQGRENIRYGVNPMLVGAFYNLVGEGRSAILADQKIAPHQEIGYPGFLAIASSRDTEEVVTATVPLL